MRFRICNREEIERRNPIAMSHAIISISTPGPGGPAKPVRNGFTLGVLFLEFHDLDTEPGKAFGEIYGPHVLFGEEHARKIRDFVQAYSTVYNITVHCDAGQSRSPAVAAALSVWLNGDDNLIRRYFHNPNTLVYRRLLDFLTAGGPPGS